MQTYVPRCVTDISPWNRPARNRGLPAGGRRLSGLGGGEVADFDCWSPGIFPNPIRQLRFIRRHGRTLFFGPVAGLPACRCNRSYLIVLCFRFLCLPEMEFLNIIFCSLPAIWATSMFARGRWFVSCSHKSREQDGSDKVGSWFPPRSEPTELFCGRDCQRRCFRFPSEGVVEEHELHGGCES